MKTRSSVFKTSLFVSWTDVFTAFFFRNCFHFICTFIKLWCKRNHAEADKWITKNIRTQLFLKKPLTLSLKVNGISKQPLSDALRLSLCYIRKWVKMRSEFELNCYIVPNRVFNQKLTHWISEWILKSSNQSMKLPLQGASDVEGVV